MGFTKITTTHSTNLLANALEIGLAQITIHIAVVPEKTSPLADTQHHNLKQLYIFILKDGRLETNIVLVVVAI